MSNRYGNDPLNVQEGFTVEIEYQRNGTKESDVKTGKIEEVFTDNSAIINVNDAGRWWLRYGAVEIVQEDDIHEGRYHGTLIDIHVQKAPLPSDWPEMFPDPHLDCNHQYHWDNSEGVYRCMNCNDVRLTPKN